MAKLDISVFEKQTADLNEALKELRKTYDETVKVSFGEALKAFFEATPEVQSVFWTQYTPYFNDGDSCYFSVGDIWYNLAAPVSEEESDEDAEEDYEDDYDEGNGFFGRTREEAYKDLDIIAKLRSGELAPTQEELATWEYYYFRETTGGWNYKTRVQEPTVYTITEASLRERENEVNRWLRTIENEERDYPNREEALTNIQTIIKYINSVHPDAMESMFDDHVKVIVTREGIEVEEYEHD